MLRKTWKELLGMRSAPLSIARVLLNTVSYSRNESGSSAQKSCQTVCSDKGKG